MYKAWRSRQPIKIETEIEIEIETETETENENETKTLLISTVKKGLLFSVMTSTS
jgi:hypothetical protein